MRQLKMRDYLIISALAAGLFPAAGLAKIEWKLQLQGEVLSADRYTVRVKTADDKIVEIPMADMPSGMDLHKGSVIRFITPQIFTRTPSGDLAPAGKNAQRKDALPSLRLHGDPQPAAMPGRADRMAPQALPERPLDAAQAVRPEARDPRDFGSSNSNYDPYLEQRRQEDLRQQQAEFRQDYQQQFRPADPRLQMMGGRVIDANNPYVPLPTQPGAFSN